jgi:uncharacterized membrane protein
MSIALTLHALAFVIWVGGMFFAYMALRPAALGLEPPQRLPLWSRTFGRFFPWVWGSVIALPVTGFWMIYRMGGFSVLPIYIHVMVVLGIVMIMIFLHIFFAPYRRMDRAIAAGDIPAAAAQLAKIRPMIGINLSIGLALITLVMLGKYWVAG